MQQLSGFENRRNAKKNRRIKIAIGSVLTLLMVSFLFLFISLYPANQDEQFAFDYAKTNYQFRDPRNFKLSTRNSKEYYSVIGDRNKKERLLIFDRDGTTNKMMSTKDLVSKKKIEKVLKQNNYKKINNISPSIYKKVPVYEISFYNNKNRLGYITMDIKTGEVYRSINGL